MKQNVDTLFPLIILDINYVFSLDFTWFFSSTFCFMCQGISKFSSSSRVMLQHSGMTTITSCMLILMRVASSRSGKTWRRVASIIHVGPMCWSVQFWGATTTWSAAGARSRSWRSCSRS